MQSNPYNPSTHQKEFEFFNSMSEAIERWMVSTYPLYDQKLDYKIKQLTALKFDVEKQFDTREKQLKHLENIFIEKCKQEINEFISKEHPGISSKISTLQQDSQSLYDQLKEKIERSKEVEKKVDEKIKDLTNSSSIYKDVYSLRDEFKEFKTSFESIMKKFKVLFK